jgi:4,5-DOPA dioxygenase extradiol
VGLVARPQTIHDFGGFDPALYEITYPVDGHPALARRALEVLHDVGWAPQPDERRGLDHGAWVPLHHLYPTAEVPAFQVSLPARLDGDSAWAFGAALAPLAEEGVLIVGSSSLTHNLAEFRSGATSDERGENQPFELVAGEGREVDRMEPVLSVRDPSR